ncbi:hypothetical protein FJZ55_03930 [Candidatus Woesearchaeota archaeon]|jgi:hypothetical protein|nr:hypothetical protein [Candidatus Woesearchaeota archaeon]
MHNKNRLLILSFLVSGLGGCPGQGAWARDAAHAHSPTQQKPATPAANPAQLACKVTISSREDREVIILKLQQRMDCLEVKLDELNREVTVLRAR